MFMNNEDKLQQAYDDELMIKEAMWVTFNTDRGKEVLEHLRSETIEFPTFQENNISDRTVELDPNTFMLLREGNNQVVRYIERKMKEYEQYQKENS